MTEPGSSERGFAAEQIDTGKPHPARIYDYLLGGWDNYEVDRQAAERIVELAPDARVSARANRNFLHRAVRGLVESGVRQIIDIGTGIPTSPNTHEIATGVSEDARVVYVDNDPIVATHAGAKLINTDNSGFVLADLRDTRSIMEHPVISNMIDFDQPVALMLIAVLHFIQDKEDPIGIIRELTERFVPGSRLIITHFTLDFHKGRGDTSEVYEKSTARLTPRGYDAILPFFDGFDLLEPGLVQAPLWHPDGPLPEADELRRIAVYGGAAVKE